MSAEHVASSPRDRDPSEVSVVIDEGPRESNRCGYFLSAFARLGLIFKDADEERTFVQQRRPRQLAVFILQLVAYAIFFLVQSQSEAAQTADCEDQSPDYDEAAANVNSTAPPCLPS